METDCDLKNLGQPFVSARLKKKKKSILTAVVCFLFAN